jgi:hypothetical protein
MFLWIFETFWMTQIEEGYNEDMFL